MSSSRALCCLPSVKKQNMTLLFFSSLYNKTIIRFGFCGIQNNRGLGKSYQPQPSADNPDSTLIVLDITRTSSNNCLLDFACYCF